MNLCETCFPGATELVEFSNYSLCYIQGSYVVLAQPGHRDYEILSWMHKPWIDPVPLDNLDDEGADDVTDEEWALSDSFIEEAGAVFIHERQLVGGWNFVNDMIKLGYDPKESGGIEFWLFDWLGKRLKHKEDHARDYHFMSNGNMWTIFAEERLAIALKKPSGFFITGTEV